MRATPTRPSPSRLSSAASIVIEMTRYRRAPSLRKTDGTSCRPSGTITLDKISSERRRVLRLPTMKSLSSRRRTPEQEVNSTSASRIRRGGTLSAAGEALQRFPAIVPRFCTCTAPTSRAAARNASKQRGREAAAISLQVVAPPMRTSSGENSIPRNSPTRETSMTAPLTLRLPSAGKKSVPPASTCPSPH